MSAEAFAPAGLRWGAFIDQAAEQRFLASRGSAPGRIAARVMWAIAVPGAVAFVLDGMLLSGLSLRVVLLARAVLVVVLVGAGLVCTHVRSNRRLVSVFSVSVLLALVAYGTIAVSYHQHLGRSDYATVLSVAAAAILSVHPGTSRRIAPLIPAFLAAVIIIGGFVGASLAAMAWNFVTVAVAQGFGFATNLMLNSQARAAYAINERLARSESELRRLREAETRSAQRALARREDAWQALVTSAPVLVLIADESGCVTFANHAADQLGFHKGASLWTVFAVLTDGDPSQAGPDFLTNVCKLGQRAQFDARVKQGETWRRYNGHAAPIGGAAPHSEAMIVAVDVTHSHELSEELHAAQKQQTMGALAAGVAHDVNNLLAVILGAAELSTLSKSIDDRTRTNLESILSAVARASRLTRQLLMFASRRPSLVGSVDANLVLTDLDLLFRRLLGLDVQIVFDLDPTLPPLQIDQSHLEQILLNLVTNARDAMASNGTLRLTTRAVDGGGEITIGDSGCGMSEEVKARMFEPFFTTKAPGQGTGIGLATVRRALARFGGRVEVQSTPQVGTEVSLWLKSAPKVAPITLHALAPEGPRCRVLLVDDEPEVLRLAAAMLEQHGYEARQAATRAEALQCFEDFRPDVLLTDVRMPGTSGRDLAEELRALQPGLRVVFMSGCVDDLALLEAVDEGKELLLDKPFTSTELVAMIERAQARPVPLPQVG